MAEIDVLKKSQAINTWSSQKLYYHFFKKHQKKWTVKRGEVYFANLGENIGSEENKNRPVVILEANSYSYNSSIVIVAIISSSKMTLNNVQVPIQNIYTYIDNNGVTKNLIGTIDLCHIRTIGKERFTSSVICKLTSEMDEVDRRLPNILGFGNVIKKKDNIIRSLNGRIQYLIGKNG